MTDRMSREELIASMTEELTPVRRINPRDGALLIGFATLVSGIVSISVFDFWTGMMLGEASPYFWITNGLLLLLGAASTAALAAGALPRIGSRSSAPAWSAAMLAVMPIAALITITTVELNHDHSGDVPSMLNDPATWYWECGAYAFAAGFIVFVASVLFLRQGAPVSLERSGWMAGLTAGALGSVAYGITCPLDSIAHIGIWHVLPVALWAVIGRFAVPPLIRW